MLVPAEKKKLSGWGRYSFAESYVFRPEQWKMLNAVIGDSRVPDILARGLGRSLWRYGVERWRCTGKYVAIESFS